MTERHELRWGGFAGLGFVVLTVLANVLGGVPPRMSASADSIRSYAAGDPMLLGGLLTCAGAGLVIWFAAAFAEAIREREERSDVHLALLAGSVLTGAALFAYGVGIAVLGYTAGSITLGSTVALFQAMMVFNAMIGVAAALPLAAAGIGVLRTRLMPDWLGYLGIAAAAVSLLAGFAIFFESGTWAPGGSVIPFVSLAAGGVFVVSASVFMVREHLPQVTPAVMPQV